MLQRAEVAIILREDLVTKCFQRFESLGCWNWNRFHASIVIAVLRAGAMLRFISKITDPVTLINAKTTQRIAD